jgi:hypothetical protein
VSRWLIVVLMVMLNACSSAGRAPEMPIGDTGPPEGEIEAPQWPLPVGNVQLNRPASSAEVELLDVALVVFDPGLPDDPSVMSKRGIFPVIRKAEARYLPVVLRHTLIAAGTWGVVRVLPEPDQTAQLLVTGEIIHSDGVQLVVQIKAIDAAGRIWLDRLYVDRAQASDYPVAPDGDPFADLHRQIANDLVVVRGQLGKQLLQRIADVSLIRYAASLSPEAFGDYLHEDQGSYSLARLPAEGDPMLGRVQRIRNQEHLFIDTVDEQYANLYEEMTATYHLWRQYGREQTIYKEQYQQRLSERDPQGQRGSFAAMQQTYNAFKWSKVQVQDLEELAVGFSTEVSPTAMEVSGQVFKLSGSLETQYAEWRRILRSIFALETGLNDPPNTP